MVDTASINWVIEKLSSAWGKIAPQVQNISEQYVKYTVLQAWTGMWIAAASFVFFSVMAVVGYLMDDCDINPFVLIGGIGAIVSVLFLAFGINDVVMASHFPQMYAIQQLIDKK